MELTSCKICKIINRQQYIKKLTRFSRLSSSLKTHFHDNYIAYRIIESYETDRLHGRINCISVGIDIVGIDIASFSAIILSRFTSTWSNTSFFLLVVWVPSAVIMIFLPWNFLNSLLE